MLTDAHRLLELVRRMNANEFAGTFRKGLPPQALMSVITALPTQRLNDLMDRARSATWMGKARLRRPQRASAGTTPWARVIRAARTQAGMSQVELAAALGVKQSTVSQWERGIIEPSTERLLDLLAVLPGLAEALPAMAAKRAAKAGLPVASEASGLGSPETRGPGG
jgi:DNA-binding transcriptional regulator YiaG